MGLEDGRRGHKSRQSLGAALGKATGSPLTTPRRKQLGQHPEFRVRES